jgi:hypothetical protein
MKSRIPLAALALSCVVIFSALTLPDEGMWLMDQIGKLPIAEMRKHGLELTPEQIYNPNGTSLKDAIILLGGGTSSFISPDGLILTNHHVAFSAIQSVSSVQEDYLKDGFYAKTKEEELSIPTYTAQVVISETDVTNEVLGAVNDTMSAESRTKTIQAKSREIEKKAKGTTDFEYRVAEMYNGVKYHMFGYQVFRDVRLAYAPPTAIGNYGGEIDNWYWPRHTGDFSLMRVYATPEGKPAKYSKQNVPYKPKVFLPMSIDGYTEGSFAMIMGFPGRTYRYYTSPEITLAKDETLPLTMELYKKRMDIIEAAGKNNRAVEIQYASRWRGLANTYKKYQGILEGMQQANILALRKNEEVKFMDFLHSKPELTTKYGSVLANIATAYDEFKLFNRKQIVIGQLLSASDVLSMANRFRNLAVSFAKDSTGKMKPNPTNVNDLTDFIPTAYKNTDLAVDKELLAALIAKATNLPQGQQIQAVQRITGNSSGEEREKKIKEFVNDLYNNTKLKTTEGCQKLLSKSADDIRDDDFVKLSIELDKDNAPLLARSAAFNAKISLARAHLLEAWMAWKGPDIYPDANRTLRFTYGTVESYNPRDAVHYNYETTLTGVIEKSTGTDPFIVPQKLHDLWEKKDFSRYADNAIHDVPVAFLANLDITGGNSGSPVINGKGEIIGLAFDGNWESVVGDYVFQESLNRTISVDSRYILFILDKYSNAQNLLNEITIASHSVLAH